MEYTLILTMLAAGSGWLMYLREKRECKKIMDIANRPDAFAKRRDQEIMKLMRQLNDANTSIAQQAGVIADTSTKISPNTPRDANGRFVKGGE